MFNYFKFDEEKALEVILYLANRSKNKDFYNILKCSYLADKQHLGVYGRFITGDSYCAMDFGPVPSNMYNMIKAARDNDQYHNDFNVSGYSIYHKRDANLQYLSESDIECLNLIINKYGDSTFDDIHDASKDKAYEKYYKTNTSNPIPIDEIARILPNSKEIAEYLSYNF